MYDVNFTWRRMTHTRSNPWFNTPAHTGNKYSLERLDGFWWVKNNKYWIWNVKIKALLIKCMSRYLLYFTLHHQIILLGKSLITHRRFTVSGSRQKYINKWRHQLWWKKRFSLCWLTLSLRLRSLEGGYVITGRVSRWSSAASAVWSRRIMQQKLAQIKQNRPRGRWGEQGWRIKHGMTQ